MRLLPSLALVLAAGIVSRVTAEDPPSELPGILDKIRKGSPTECIEALAKLTPGKEDRAANPIAIRLRDESDAQTRASLQAALVAFPSASRVRAIKAALEKKDSPDDFKRLVCEMLADCKDEPAAAVVAKVAFDSEMKATREAAQATLVGLGDSAVKSTSYYMKGTNQKICDEAVIVLQNIDTAVAASALASFMVVGSEKELLRICGCTTKTRDSAVNALVAMGDEAVPPLLAGIGTQLYKKWCSYVLQKISGEFHTQEDKAGWTDWWKRRQAEKAGK